MSRGRYTPIFSGIVESSLWDEEDAVVKVFLTMLALMDGDYVVRKDEYRLAFYSRKKEEEVRHALRVLAAPDKKRPGQAHDGRRIRKVVDGWEVLNGEKYQKAMLEANRRAYMRRYMANQRAALKSKPMVGELTAQQMLESGVPQEEVDRYQAGLEHERLNHQPGEEGV